MTDSVIQVTAYEPHWAEKWDQFIGSSRNGTFLLKRRFCDYHQSRFQDASALVTRSNDELLAVLPATRHGSTLRSHGGLSYGGLVMAPKLSQTLCLRVFTLLSEFYQKQGIERITYKAIPSIFHRTPGEEDLYALFQNGARLVRRDASTAVSLQGSRLAYSDGRKYAISQAKKAGIIVSETTSTEGFHELLSAVLKRHNAEPVHSVDEMSLLMERFPESIRLFEARRGTDLHAGAWVFDCGPTVHTQYLAASADGRKTGALDFIIHQLLQTFADRKFLNFGISTEDEGRTLNEGLIFQKEGFGGRTVLYDHYDWSLNSTPSASSTS